MTSEELAISMIGRLAFEKEQLLRAMIELKQAISKEAETSSQLRSELREIKQEKDRLTFIVVGKDGELDEARAEIHRLLNIAQSDLVEAVTTPQDDKEVPF